MAKHSPPDDSSFSESVVRHLGAAVALVVVVALAFWGIGQLRDDPSVDVASGPGSAATSPTAAATAEPTAPPTASPADTAAPAETATPTEDVTATEEPATTGTATATETEAATGGGDIDPAEISVQVLDATGDGGDTAAEVADQLRSDGFNVVAENKAVRTYEVTTVFYTPGNEAKAEQLAAMYGYREVAPEPGNLSHTVDVHLVVGQDA